MSLFFPQVQTRSNFQGIMYSIKGSKLRSTYARGTLDRWDTGSSILQQIMLIRFKEPFPI